MQILKTAISACLLLCLTLNFAGCGNNSPEAKREGVLVLQPPVGSDPEQVMRTLKGRFEDFRPAPSASVEAKLDDQGRMQFFFRQGAPESSILGTLIMQRGVLTATLENGEQLYSSADIIDASTVVDRGTVYLNLVVTDEAAQRIGDGTARNVGKVINVVLDGFNVFRSTITEPFSKNFRLSADYPEKDVRVIQALLDHGTLPGAVGFVSMAGDLFEPAKTETNTENHIENPTEISADKIEENTGTKASEEKAR